MPLAPGQALSHYEVLGALGSGAMGEVYRARDTRLGREVAIKVLPEEFAGDDERLARFEREAKALAALNHPSVAQIFGVDQVGDTCFLVLELVPGETLEERLRRGPLPPEEALEVGRQLAEGLEAAHEAGVVHRDLKPANLRLTPDGKLKVLDFGLAKPMRAGLDPRSSDSVLSTAQGRLLGTPLYMAPEQARGRASDRRADVWAFGCVLYECLSGARPFAGESLSDLLGAILRDEPDLARLPAATPARVRELVARCLEKDPRRRLQDMGEARIALERAREEPAAPPATRAGGRRLLAVTAVAALAFAVLWARGAWLAGRGAAPRTATHLALRLPPPLRLARTNPAQTGLVALAPDGSRLVFVGSEGGPTRLYVRALGAPAVTPLAGTEDASSPFFSPDGHWVGFFAFGKLKKVALAGGAPLVLADVGLNRGGAWGPDDTIVFTASMTAPLQRVAASGGPVTELTRLDAERGERSHRWPVFLPGGREVAFTVGTVDKPGDYDDARIDAVELATGARRTLLSGASMVRVLPPDRLVFGRDGKLFVLPLAAARGIELGSTAAALEGVSGVPESGVLDFDVSTGGDLVCGERDPRANQRELAWLARDATIEPLGLPVREYQTPRLSPDGTRIALGIGPGGGRSSDVWIVSLADGGMTRLTFDTLSGTPSWTADGQRVLYASTASGHERFFVKRADGTGEAELVHAFADGVPRFPIGLTPDGLVPFVSQGGGGSAQDVFALRLADDSLHEVTATAASETYCALSPDGRWIAYVTDDTGVREVFVQGFPDRRGRWQVSDGGGGAPCWARDGRELYYVSGRRILGIRVTTEPSFAHGPPFEVVAAEFESAAESIVNYDVAPDGRFLIVRGTSSDSYDRHLNVVSGWAASLPREP